MAGSLDGISGFARMALHHFKVERHDDTGKYVVRWDRAPLELFLTENEAGAVLAGVSSGKTARRAGKAFRIRGKEHQVVGRLAPLIALNWARGAAQPHRPSHLMKTVNALARSARSGPAKLTLDVRSETNTLDCVKNSCKTVALIAKLTF